jgi:hypothetical protein
MSFARCVLVGLALIFGVACVGLAQAPANSPASSAAVAKPAPTPVLVELFTSEGCNNCPEADELVRKLDGTETVTGQKIIALSEHVTYWNQLGWTDPFSNEAFSDRQNTYGENFNLDEIYTPQVVVNGVQGELGSDRAAILAAVSFQALPLPVSIEVLSARPSGDNLYVAYMVSGKVPNGGVEMFAALVDDADTVEVQHGENAGRTMTHPSVVRSFGKGVMLKPGVQSILTLPLPGPPALPAAASQHLIVFAQIKGQGRVLGMLSQPISVAFPTTKAKPAAVGGRTLKAR